ncbi:MAG TPA: hypothetical protein VIF62_25550 [Labilithrix sp.]
MFSVAAAALFVSAAASATSRPLPFTYPNETLPEGQLELELYTDVNPLRVHADAADPTKGNLWEPAYQLQSEFEYGLTDRFELGFYQVFEATPQDGGDNSLRFDGLKWRVRTRLAEPGQWPVDIGLYLELETMHDELALEEKVNLQRRLGRLRLMANLWVEQQVARPLDKSQRSDLQFVVNPTAGFVYEVTPTFQPGAEYWSRGLLSPEGEGQERHDSAVQHYVGPTVHLNFGKLWWSAGVYAHLNDVDKPPPGGVWGPVWFRSVIGLEL